MTESGFRIRWEAGPPCRGHGAESRARVVRWGSGPNQGYLGKGGPDVGVSLWGWGQPVGWVPVLAGEVICHKLGVWSYQKGSNHVLHIPGISLTHPKDSKRSLSVAFPNLPLQTHSCRLSSCWQAPTPTQAMQEPPVLRSSNGGEKGRRLDKSLSFGPRTGTLDRSLPF